MVKKALEPKLSETLKKVRRAVIKIGTSVLVGADGNVSHQMLSGIVEAINELQKKGLHLVLVSSGAIPSGMQRLGYPRKPQRIPELQACAAIGQPHLMALYQKAFGSRAVAQILLTRGDLEDRLRFLNAKHTLMELLHREVIPIINENDTVAVEEIRVGDNDNLAALVTNLVDADLLILLTDQEGLFTADPRVDPNASRIPVVEDVDADLLQKAADTLAAHSTGGMRTKLEAAQKAAQFGIPTIVANGRDPKVLQKIFAGESIGTLFLPKVDSLTARKHWIAHTLKPQGTILVDAGAKVALIDGKKSLLPSGILQVKGRFSQGDPVDIVDESGNVLARGMAAYDASEISRILGRKSSDIETLLGYKGPDEVIHRDDLVLL